MARFDAQQIGPDQVIDEPARSLRCDDGQLVRSRKRCDAVYARPQHTSGPLALSLSPKTVSNYVSSIFAKLQVADRAQAIVRAREAGLGGGK